MHIFPKSISAMASILLTAGTVMLASPGHAASTENAPRQIAVQLADLDLVSRAGHATAERRIRLAADRVCSTFDPAFPVDGTCRRRAVAGAMAEIAQGRPALASR